VFTACGAQILLKKKTAQNQAPHQTHGHENTTMIAHTHTVGAMEARMSVIGNHLQECMLELKTERAKSQITEEQASDKQSFRPDSWSRKYHHYRSKRGLGS